LPGPAPAPVYHDFSDDFSGSTLKPQWNFVRNPVRTRYTLHDHRICLHGGADTLSTPLAHPTLIAVRQPAFCTETTVYMEGPVTSGQKSGLTAYYNHHAHYEIFVTRRSDGHYVCVGKQVGDIAVISSAQKIDYHDTIELRICSDRTWYTFSYRLDGDWVELGKGMTAFLCTETTPDMTYTGTFLGLFSENGSMGFSSFALKVMEETT
jgi:alpha-N-arabinofuranosidase